MRLGKTEGEALKSALGPDDTTKVRGLVQDNGVFGWSVFDKDGTELAGQSVPETMTAVCSNVLDMAGSLGSDLGEDGISPTISFGRSGKGIQVLPLENANLVVIREKPTRKEH